MVDDGYVVGIDGGGTWSRGVAVAVGSGEVVASAEGGALNFYTTSVDAFQENLTSLRASLRGGCPVGMRLLHTVVGTAALLGGSSPRERSRATGGLDRGGPGELTLVGDAVAAAMGATGGSPGVLVIAGTGSVAVAIGADGSARYCGGLGPLIGGDPGSAHWMAAQAVVEAQRQDAERRGGSSLADAICNYFEVEVLTELIPLVYGSGAGSSTLAGLSGDLAARADPPEGWGEIEERAGEELAVAVAPLAGVGDAGGIEVFVAGSVLEKNRNVVRSFAAQLSRMLGVRGLVVRKPKFDAPSGAVMLAMGAIGCDVTPEILQNLDAKDR